MTHRSWGNSWALTWLYTWGPAADQPDRGGFILNVSALGQRGL